VNAPAPTPAEQSEIDRFGIFAEERVVEEVARAIQANKESFPPPWETLTDLTQGMYRRLAVAAVAAYRATQDGGAEAVLADDEFRSFAAAINEARGRELIPLDEPALAPQAADGEQ
jgi:hypothetical protein